MSTALYRRYRPDSFAEMIGQEHVTAPLMQALRSNRVNHAYLFSGPRGCGKTTSARILARILNCAQNTEANPTDTPCGQCPSCIELARGGSGSLDVVEIDAASHGGVDDARDLRERATFSPTRDRFKIFILDEAHMVTAQGFNALLKIVEEPPPYLKFIFATTEPEKVIGTIRSRTHHYPFKLVAPEVMHNYLIELCKAEGIIARDGVLPLVVRAGGGSVRDTLSVLDQLIAGSAGGVLEYELAVALLGFTPATLLDEVVEALGRRDGAAMFRVVEQIVGTGHEPRRFVEDLLERLRDLIVLSLSGDAAQSVLPGVPSDQLQRMIGQAGSLGVAELSRSADVVNSALTEMSGATSPRLHLELLCARLLLPSTDSSAGGLGARIDGIERALKSGIGVAAESRSTPTTVGASDSMAQQSTSVPVADVPVAPRKSLRPDSTRRKPAVEVDATSSQQAVTHENQPVASGSIFAPAAPTGIFAQPDASSLAQSQPLVQAAGSVEPSVSAPAPAIPHDEPQVPQLAVAAKSSGPQYETPRQPAAVQAHQQEQQLGATVAPSPQIPEQVGQFDGPRDEMGRPLAANTGWHTAQSRVVSAAQQAAERTAPSLHSEEPAGLPIPGEEPVGQPISREEPVGQPVRPEEPVGQPMRPADSATASEQSGGETQAFALRWPEVMETLAGINRAVWALVNQYGAVEHLNSTTLYVSVPNENLLRTLSARGGDHMIAQAIKEKLGFDVAVVVDVQGSPQFPKASSSSAQTVAAPTQTVTADTTHRPEQANTSDGEWANAAQYSGPTPEGNAFDSATSVESHDSASSAESYPSAQSASTLASASSAPEPYTPPSESPANADSNEGHFDPIASVSIFGAAVGALASGRAVRTPDLPRIDSAVQDVAHNLAASEAEADESPNYSAYTDWSLPEPAVEYDGANGSIDNEQQARSYSEPVATSSDAGTDAWSRPMAEGSQRNSAQTDVEQQSTAVAPQSAAHPNTQPRAETTEPAVSSRSVPSPGSSDAGSVGTVPPWEETPRQAAERRAAELAAREAAKVVVEDDPQPDDEDLDSLNMVGVPLVMSMFGATIIDEITEQY